MTESPSRGKLVDAPSTPARSLDRDRGLHSRLSPAAASAADAGVAGQPTHRPPLRGRHRRERRCADARACRSRPNSSGIRQIPGLCVVEPRQGNCHAINAAFETALAMFPAATSFLMIDDDEIASPDWLERMMHAAEATGADVVGGPVLPQFRRRQLKRGLRRHPAFRPAYDRSGPVPVIYGCGNCLITRPVFARLGRSRLRPALQFPRRRRYRFLHPLPPGRHAISLGGGGRHHRNRAAAAGPISAGWCVRGLRIGAINYHVQRKAARTPWSRARLIAKMLALLPLSLFRAVRLVVSRTQGRHCHASDDRRGRQRAGRHRHRAATLQSLEDRLVSQFVTTSEVRAVVRRIAAPAGDGHRPRRDLHRRAAAGVDFAAAVRRSRRSAARRRHAPAMKR